MSTNDYLVLAGTFHGYLPSSLLPIHTDWGCRVHAITRTITPRIPLSAPTSTPSPSTPASASASGPGSGPGSGGSALPNPGIPATGLEFLETEKFRLTCFQTLTGTKFLLFTDPTATNVDGVMRKVYELYADFVMKNPFYQLDMPVRCEAFDRHLGGWLRGRA